jgi:hypothetical protein
MIYALVAVSVTLLATNIYWAVVCNRLINKVMCRDYAEFKHVDTMPKRHLERKIPVEDVDAYEQQRARDLNSQFAL